MKYISIDIETTSDSPKTGDILSFGAVIEDTEKMLPLKELPRFEVYIENPEPIKGNHYALQMNRNILYKIATGETEVEIIPPQILEYKFACFLQENGFEPKEGNSHVTITAAGKNFAGFDAGFLEKLEWGDFVRIRKRVLDPAPLYTDFYDDKVPPDLKTCKERAGLSGEVSHDALQDALDVVAVLRKCY